MNYCKNCGTKLKKNSKFCKNCGYDLEKGIKRNTVKVQNKEKKEINNENILLNIGIILIITSSLLFSFISWHNLSNLLKVGIMCGEFVLFLVLAFTCKILKNNNTFKACYFISVIFLPIIFIMVNVYKLIPIFNEGAYLFVYLALISFICLVIYIISYFFVSNKYLLFVIISFYSFIISLLKIFDLKEGIILLVINITVLLFVIINRLLKGKKFNLIINFMLLILFFINLYVTDNKIIYMSYSLIYVMSLYINYYKNEASALNTFVPVLSSIILSVSLSNLLDKNMFIFIMSLCLLLINLLPFNSKYSSNKYMANIVFVIGFVLLSIYSIDLYKSLLIMNIIYVIYFVTMILVDKNNALNHFLLTFSMVLIIYSILNIVNYNSSALLFTIASIFIYSLSFIYSDKKLKNIYKIISYVLFTISTIIVGYNKKFEYITIINLVLWLITYILNIKNSAKVMSLIGFILSLLMTSYYLHLNAYLVGVGVILLLFVSYEILKDDNYLVIGSIFLLFYLFVDINTFNRFLILAISLLYFYSYYKINKINKYKFLKTLLTFFGLLLIYEILLIFKLPIVIFNLILLFIYINIFIVLYLAEKADNLHLLIYSVVFLIPITSLIDHFSSGILNDNLYVCIVIMYFLIIPIALNKKNIVFYIFNIIFTLILLNPEFNVLVLDLILSIILFIYGAILKDTKYIYYSLIYLILSLAVGLYTIINSYILLILLTLIGTGLIIYVIINESKKRVK